MKKTFENIVRKGENAGNQHFLLFPQCFLPFPKQGLLFYSNFFMSSANAFNLDQSKVLSFGKELTSFPFSPPSDNQSLFMSQGRRYNNLTPTYIAPKRSLRDYINTSETAVKWWKTRCVCETLMPPETPIFGKKHDPDIWPWSLQMTLTLVPKDVNWWDVPSYQI